MGRLLKSWFFFLALFLFLLAAAVSLPQLAQRLFGRTEEQLTQAVDGAASGLQEVWARAQP